MPLVSNYAVLRSVVLFADLKFCMKPTIASRGFVHCAIVHQRMYGG